MKQEHIQHYLDKLKATWDYTQEELDDIRYQMSFYAVAALIDSKVRDEVFEISGEISAV